jgi:hypothetical protein
MFQYSYLFYVEGLASDRYAVSHTKAEHFNISTYVEADTSESHTT